MLIIPVVEKLKQEDPFEFQDQIEEEGTNFVVLIHLTATSVYYVIHSLIILWAFNIYNTVGKGTWKIEHHSALCRVPICRKSNREKKK